MITVVRSPFITVTGENYYVDGPVVTTRDPVEIVPLNNIVELALESRRLGLEVNQDPPHLYVNQVYPNILPPYRVIQGIAPATVLANTEAINSINNTTIPVLQSSIAAAAAAGIPVVSTLSSTPDEGDVVYLTTDDKIYRYTGSAWTSSVSAADITGAIVKAQLAADSVGTDQIEDGAVDSAQLASGSIDAIHFSSGAVTAPALGTGSVIESKLAAGAVTTVKLGDGAVTSEKLATDAITTVKIANDAVTRDKLATDAVWANDITQGQFSDSVISVTAVTQHQASLAIDWSQLTNIPSSVNLAHLPVTLASGRDYLTLNGQELTLNAIDLTTDVTGLLSISNLASNIQTSLGLADTALQPGDNISDLTNDAGYITATLTEEQVEDYVGGMLSGNTETLITVTYQDSDGTIDFVVNNDLSAYDNTTSDFQSASQVSSIITSEVNKAFVDALNINADTLDGIDSTGFALVSHTHSTTDITSGTFADARIAESNVTQHQAALSITESQISDLGNYGELNASESVTGLWSFGTMNADLINIRDGGSNQGNLSYSDTYGLRLNVLGTATNSIIALSVAGTEVASVHSSGLEMNQPITLPSDPSADMHAATKQYVDALSSGINVLTEVKTITTSALPSYVQAGTGVGATLTGSVNGALPDIGGYTPSLNDRILVTSAGSSAGSDNGIYTVTNLGSGSTKWVLTRATDFDEDSEITAGSYVFIEAGDEAYYSYIMTTANVTVDTTTQVWNLFSQARDYTAGTGIQIASGVISVTTVPIEHGGTGAVNTSAARTNLGVAIGSDVQEWNAQLDTLSTLSAGQAADLVAITTGEYEQIQNINSVTISNTQWGYLGALSSDPVEDNDIGVTVQAYDAQLNTLATMSAAQATGLVGTSGTASFFDLSINGLGFIDSLGEGIFTALQVDNIIIDGNSISTSTGGVSITKNVDITGTLQVIGNDGISIERRTASTYTPATLAFTLGNNASANSDVNYTNIKSEIVSGPSGSETGLTTIETRIAGILTDITTFGTEIQLLRDTNITGMLDVSGLTSLDGGINVNDEFTVSVAGVTKITDSLTLDYAGTNLYATIFGPVNRDLRFELRDNDTTDSFDFRNSAGDTLVEIQAGANVIINASTEINDTLNVSGTLTVDTEINTDFIRGISQTETFINFTDANNSLSLVSVNDMIFIIDSNAGQVDDYFRWIADATQDGSGTTLMELHDNGRFSVGGAWVDNTATSLDTFQFRGGGILITNGAADGAVTFAETDTSIASRILWDNSVNRMSLQYGGADRLSIQNARVEAHVDLVRSDTIIESNGVRWERTGASTANGIYFGSPTTERQFSIGTHWNSDAETLTNFYFGRGTSPWGNSYFRVNGSGQGFLGTGSGNASDRIYSDDYHPQSYNDLTDVPSTFTPSSHNHTVSDITDFNSASPNWTGQHNFDTDTGTVPLLISRFGSDTQEVLSIGVYDTHVLFDYIEDSGEATSGQFIFRTRKADNSDLHDMTFTDGILTAEFFSGDGSSLTNVDADTLDGINSSGFVQPNTTVTLTQLTLNNSGIGRLYLGSEGNDWLEMSSVDEVLKYYSNNNNVFQISGSGVITANGGTSTNWNTAYGWGDWSVGVNKAFVDALNVDADTLDGFNSSQSDTASTVAVRNSSSDIYARLFRSTYTNQSTISGAIAYRVSTTDNYIRFCSDTSAIRTFLDVPATSHTHTFNSLTSKDSGTGHYSTTGNLESGRGFGGVALTIDDGQGNANVTFNHANGVAEKAGNSGRIVVNTDNIGGATFTWELASNVSAGSVSTSPEMQLSQSQLNLYNNDITTTGSITVASLSLPSGEISDYSSAPYDGVVYNTITPSNLRGVHLFKVNYNNANERDAMRIVADAATSGSTVETYGKTSFGNEWVNNGATSLDQHQFRGDSGVGILIRAGATSDAAVTFANSDTGISSRILWDKDENELLFQFGSASKLGIETARVVAYTDIIPSTDSAYDLGSSSLRYANVYADNLYGNGSNITNVTASAVAWADVTGKPTLENLSDVSSLPNAALGTSFFMVADGELNNSKIAPNSIGLSEFNDDLTNIARTNQASVSFDGGTNTTVNIISDDAGESILRLYGSSQGTGRLYVGQSLSYGGGIEYNGDNSPGYSGAGSDYITLYRVSNGTPYWTARNLHSSNDWEFRGNVDADTFTGNTFTGGKFVAETSLHSGSATLSANGSVEIGDFNLDGDALFIFITSGEDYALAIFRNTGGVTILHSSGSWLTSTSLGSTPTSMRHYLVKDSGKCYIKNRYTFGQDYTWTVLGDGD